MCERSFGQFSLNFLTGANYSNCKFENFEGISPKARVGYFFGLAPSYRIGEKVQFQIDFQYSLKGYNTGTQAPTSAEFRYGYLDMIPEVEFRVYEHLALGFGVNYGIKLNEQFKIGALEWSNAGNYGTVSSTDFGLTGRLKIDYKNVFGFVRYNLGLVNIAAVVFTDGNGQEIEDAKQMNRNLQIGIGYKLRFP